MRSLSTSFVALLPVLSLLIVGSGIMGATSLEDFALALAAGLFIGSYSSIFVAAPMLAWWKEREPQYRRARRAPRAGPRRSRPPARPVQPVAAPVRTSTHAGRRADVDSARPTGSTRRRKSTAAACPAPPAVRAPARSSRGARQQRRPQARK